MAMYAFDKMHNHATWGPRLSHELEEEGRLHRHRIAGAEAHPVFTTWAHNTPAHSHRLPDGSWSRPRTVTRPPEMERQTLDRSPLDRLRFRRPAPPPAIPDGAPLAPTITAAQALAIVDALAAEQVQTEQPKAKAKRGSRKKASDAATPDLGALAAALTGGVNAKSDSDQAAKPKKSRAGRAKKSKEPATPAH